jgi:hypothetical protein
MVADSARSLKVTLTCQVSLAVLQSDQCNADQSSAPLLLLLLLLLLTYVVAFPCRGCT